MDEQERMKVFFELFDPSLPRLGPGDDASTRRALSAALAAMSGEGGAPEPTGLRILDLGCGNGAQTIQLAKHVDGTILAVDNHQPFLDELRRRVEAEGVLDRVQIRLGDMASLEVDDGSFDLIWSEGALYSMGFGDGLKAYYSKLAPGGVFGVTELCWLRPDVPEECLQYFAAMYPPMTDVDANLAAIQSCGYALLEHFTLPELSWWDAYYRPLEKRLDPFREKYAAEPEKLEVVESIQMEIDYYRKYSSYYGYVFYLMRR